MARIKIDYGIDLGTTNSALCRMEKGEPVIIKTDVLKDTMPSCVSINKKGTIRLGDAAYNGLKSDKRSATKSWAIEDSNTYIEFKRTMATDKLYHSSNLGRDLSSEELSSEVLKTLKSFVTDEKFSSIVITVPAKFTVNQKTATIEAAKMAGFKKVELLQEPIAAAMAYGISSDDKDGLWMVFDFGGGTFDVALIKVEDGIMQVFDTEGDNYLGGKNLDYAIVDQLIIPYLKENYSIESYLSDKDKKQVLRDAMKTYAEELKNQLSFKDKEDILSNLGDLGEDEDGEDIELDITITKEELNEVLRPLFQKSVDICLQILERNNIDGSKLSKLILVGGPTYSPLIREMLREQITENVDTSINPMTAVAMGAALFASTIDAEVLNDDIEVDTIKLDLTYESTSVENSEWVSITLPNDSKLDKVWVEFVRADKSWSSGKIEISNIGDVIELQLLQSKPNAFNLYVYDEHGNTLPCFPSEINIIQGSKVGSAPLPYNIGIAVWNESKKIGVFRMAKGLEKNKPLPAIGVINGLKTTTELKPGVDTDQISIPVYQTDDFNEAEGRPASLFEYVADVIITGDDIDEIIPSDSEVDITLKVDSSEQMIIEAHFISQDITIEKALDTSKKHSMDDAEKEINKGIKDVEKAIHTLKSSDIPIDEIETELDMLKEEYKNSSEKKMVLQNLKKILRKIDSLDKSTEWDRLEKELRSEFEQLEEAQNDLGNDDTAAQVRQLRTQIDNTIRTKDVFIAQELISKINALFVMITLYYQFLGFINQTDLRFDLIAWKDKARARELLNTAKKKVAEGEASVEILRPILASIFSLMPKEEIDNSNTGGLLR